MTASDQIFGLAGNDTLAGNGGVDFLNGGAGSDTVNYASSASGVNVDLGAYGTGSGNSWDGSAMNFLTSIENVIGSSFGDTLTGDANANTFQGNGGLDYINGGVGSDTVSYVANLVGVKVNLGAYSTGSGNSWDGTSMNILTSIENVVGSSFGDTLTGDSNNNTLNGGLGNDTLMGGMGADTFSFTDLNFGADTVADYTHGVDYLSFSSVAASLYTDFVITNNDTINVLITLTSGGTISLYNGSVIHIDATDFLFV
jgi:Ca2+-binding RTX toxin-like protein